MNISITTDEPTEPDEVLDAPNFDLSDEQADELVQVSAMLEFSADIAQALLSPPDHAAELASKWADEMAQNPVFDSHEELDRIALNCKMLKIILAARAQLQQLYPDTRTDTPTI